MRAHLVSGGKSTKPISLPAKLAQRTMATALQSISKKDMWKLLGKTQKDLKKVFPELPTMETTVDNLEESDRSHQYKRYTVYLNLLSAIVHEKLGWSTNATVINKLTRQTLRQALGGHPFLQLP
jgi:hypothetical protein